MSEGIGFTGVAIAAAFCGGVVAGATAVFLLAPQTGKKTRKDIGEVVGHTSERIGATPKALKDAYAAGTGAAMSSLRDSYGNTDPSVG